jgi:hypothetical protein
MLPRSLCNKIVLRRRPLLFSHACPADFGIREIPGALSNLKRAKYEHSVEPLVRYAALNLYKPVKLRIRLGSAIWDADYTWAKPCNGPLALQHEEQLSGRLGSKQVEHLQHYPVQAMLVTAEGELYPMVLPTILLLLVTKLMIRKYELAISTSRVSGGGMYVTIWRAIRSGQFVHKEGIMTRSMSICFLIMIRWAVYL